MTRALLTALMSLLISVHTFAFSKKIDEDDIAKVQQNMEKTEVLRLVGPPRFQRRWQGKDRWTYLIYHKREKGLVEGQKKEIHFLDGKVVYIGEPVAEQVTAAQQDELNMQMAQQEVKDWQERAQKADESREEYEDYILRTSNRHPEKATVPKFKPIN